MKEVKHRIMFFRMLFGDEFIIMVERVDVHLFVWKQANQHTNPLAHKESTTVIVSLFSIRLFVNVKSSCA